MRLIDADAAIDVVHKWLENVFCISSTADEVTVFKKLRTLPTVDAEPVRHGRWVKLDAHVGLADHRCTACQLAMHVPTSWGEPLYEYCPMCGAKMDEEVEHDKRNGDPER